jgi:hypothetical protein
VSGRRALTALLSTVALAAAGCASSSLSSAQLRTGATKACDLARQRLSAIPTPATPSQGKAFLSAGISALGPEVTALERLHPDGSAGQQYERAVSAAAVQLAALQSSLKGLKAGNDPVVAIKTLQQQLAPLERQAADAWDALGIPACNNP